MMFRKTHLHQRARRNLGFSLIEVLVAVVVLSLGLLGIIGLQLSSLRNNQSAMARSVAVFQAQSIIDAMRIDRQNAIDGNFNIGLNDTPSGTTFADNQIAAWRSRLTTHLGAGATGSIACDDTLCKIEIIWNDERATQGIANQTIETKVRL